MARRSAGGAGPWVQLALLVVALVVILTLGDQMAEGAAGCYGSFVAETGAEGASTADDGAVDDAPRPTVPGGTPVEVRFMPSGPEAVASELEADESEPDPGEVPPPEGVDEPLPTDGAVGPDPGEGGEDAGDGERPVE